MWTSASGSTSYTSALTVDSPEVRAWIDFAEINNGTFPEFPLPLGDPSVRLLKAGTCGADEECATS